MASSEETTTNIEQESMPVAVSAETPASPEVQVEEIAGGLSSGDESLPVEEETPSFSADDNESTNLDTETEESESLTRKIWGIGVRQVVFMALGAAIYAALTYATNSFFLPGSSDVSLRPGIVIPLFFGAVFGPWVGLFTGLVGNSVSDIFSYGSIFWNWEVGLGLVGFITGLVLYLTRGRYSNVRRILLAEIFSAIGLIVGLGFASLTDIWISQSTLTTVVTTEFLPALLPDLVFGLILLPILALAYEASLERIGR